eukprot:2282561-Prymnesium_polylepis.1
MELRSPSFRIVSPPPLRAALPVRPAPRPMHILTSAVHFHLLPTDPSTVYRRGGICVVSLLNGY